MTYPTIPTEVPYTDIERDMIENEPPGAFPEDQNSYWGQMRKLFADYLQANALDLFNAWYNNLDPRAVDVNDISEWEDRVGVPGDRSGITLPARRSFVQNRLKSGAFSRTLVNSIIEAFIVATFGTSTAFGSTGIPLSSGGTTLFSGVSGDPKTMYRVYYDYMNRIYYVRILNTLGEDLSGLTRELQRITPAGWTLNIADVANPLTYLKMVLSDAPNGFWRLANNLDSSGYGNFGTALGGVTLGNAASPGLLIATGTDDAAATVFDGVNDALEVGEVPLFRLGNRLSLEAWFRTTTLAAGSRNVMRKENEWTIFQSGSALQVFLPANGTWALALGFSGLVINTTYHVVVTLDGTTAKLYINGVLVNYAPWSYPRYAASSNIEIGRYQAGAEYWSGTIADVAIYDYPLSAAKILEHNLTGSNVA